MIQPTLLFVEMKSKDVTPNLSLEPALIEALMPKDHKSCNLVEFSCGGTWHNSGQKNDRGTYHPKQDIHAVQNKDIKTIFFKELQKTFWNIFIKIL